MKRFLYCQTTSVPFRYDNDEVLVWTHTNTSFLVFSLELLRLFYSLLPEEIGEKPEF